MPDFDNPYQEPRKPSQGEEDARLADNISRLIIRILRWLRNWIKHG